MGCLQSTPLEKDYIKTPEDQLEVFALKKKRPACTGMFWRPDPERKIKLVSNADWPRDGALLKGEVRIIKGAKWLAATHVKQERTNWVPAPYGAHMPFTYDNHYYLEKVE